MIAALLTAAEWLAAGATLALGYAGLSSDPRWFALAVITLAIGLASRLAADTRLRLTTTDRLFARPAQPLLRDGEIG